MRCPVLRGDRVCLRQWRAEEAEDYVDGRDDEVFRWTTERRDLTAAQAAQGFSHYDGVDGVYPFAIVEHATDRPVGNLPVTVQGDRAEIAYWLAPDARGRGLLAEASALVLSWLRSTGVALAELEIHPGNEASIRAAKRAGFTPAGRRTSPAFDETDVLVYQHLLG